MVQENSAIAARVGVSVTETIVLRERLGQGGMGEVWIAEHKALRSEVAVKLLKTSRPATPGDDTLIRFLREASAAARVKSPHVVTVFDSGISETVGPYVVMELLEGEDLESRLNRDGPLSPEQAAMLFVQLGHAVGQAHEAGLVHRDLKPGNIFLVRVAAQPIFGKVLDFGIARDLEDPITQGEPIVIGTYATMSPEQAEGREVGPSSDLYALGLVAFRALTGTHAISRESREALGAAAYRLPAAKLSVINRNLGSEVDAWFAKACAYEPSARFPDAETQCAALAAALGHAEPGERGPSVERKARERREATHRATPSQQDPHIEAPAPRRRILESVRSRVGVLALVTLAGAATLYATASTPRVPASVPVSRAAAGVAPALKSVPLRVPMLVDLHGTDRKRGEAMLLAARAAALAVNRQGGVSGRLLEVTPIDDEGDTGSYLLKQAEGARVAGNVAVVLGPTLSTQTTMAAPALARLGLAELSASASSSALAGISPTLVRLAAGDGGQAAALAGLMRKSACKRIVSIASEDVYARAFMESLALSLGLPEGLRVSIPETALREYTSVVARVDAAHADCVALIASPRLAARYLLEAQGRKERYFSGDTLASSDFIELGRGDRSLDAGSSKSVAEGVRGVRPRPADPKRSEYQAFLRLYRELANAEPVEPFLSEQFDAVIVLALALDRVGAEAEASTLHAEMKRVLEAHGGEPFGAQQLDELFRARRRGVDVVYEGASGAFTFVNGEREGTFANWTIRNGAVVDD